MDKIGKTFKDGQTAGNGVPLTIASILLRILLHHSLRSSSPFNFFSTTLLNFLAPTWHPPFPLLLQWRMHPSFHLRPTTPFAPSPLALLIDIAFPKLSHLSQASSFTSVDCFPVRIQTYSSITYLKNSPDYTFPLVSVSHIHNCVA